MSKQIALGRRIRAEPSSEGPADTYSVVAVRVRGWLTFSPLGRLPEERLRRPAVVGLGLRVGGQQLLRRALPGVSVGPPASRRPQCRGRHGIVDDLLQCRGPGRWLVAGNGVPRNAV